MLLKATAALSPWDQSPLVYSSIKILRSQGSFVDSPKQHSEALLRALNHVLYLKTASRGNVACLALTHRRFRELFCSSAFVAVAQLPFRQCRSSHSARQMNRVRPDQIDDLAARRAGQVFLRGRHANEMIKDDPVNSA